MKRTNLQSILAGAVCLSLFIGTLACGPGTGTAKPLATTYQSLVSVQAALVSLKGNAAVVLKYKPELNLAIASYNTAETTFLAVNAGSKNDQVALDAQVAALVANIAGLVGRLTPAAAPKIQGRMQARTVASAHVNFTDILTILSVAAAAAQSIPAASPYAGLAQIILQAVAAGNAAYATASHAGIDTSMLFQIDPIA